MRYIFTQFDTDHEPQVDGAFGLDHQAAELSKLVALLPRQDLDVERLIYQALDHNGPEGASPTWFYGWRTKALTLLQRYTAPGLEWYFTANGDLFLLDRDDRLLDDDDDTTFAAPCPGCR
jgi:hypothetical protein